MNNKWGIDHGSLPANEKPILLMPIGYAAEGAHPSKLHTLYPEQDNMVRYL